MVILWLKCDRVEVTNRVVLLIGEVPSKVRTNRGVSTETSLE
jgi:hypothetical protein